MANNMIELHHNQFVNGSGNCMQNEYEIELNAGFRFGVGNAKVFGMGWHIKYAAILSQPSWSIDVYVW